MKNYKFEFFFFFKLKILNNIGANFTKCLKKNKEVIKCWRFSYKLFSY